MCNYIPSHRSTIKYRIVMNSSPGYYSILDPFDQRSEDSKLILKEFDEKKIFMLLIMKVKNVALCMQCWDRLPHNTAGMY